MGLGHQAQHRLIPKGKQPIDAKNRTLAHFSLAAVFVIVYQCNYWKIQFNIKKDFFYMKQLQIYKSYKIHFKHPSSRKLFQLILYYLQIIYQQ